MPVQESGRNSTSRTQPTPALTSRAYARVLVPFVLSTLTQPLMSAVDTAVMGRMDNPSCIAGVAVGAVIFNTIYWLLGFLRVGSTGFSAQASTDSDPERLYKALLVPCCMAVCLSLVLLVLQGPIFRGAMLIMSLDEATRDVARTYYDILIWGAPLVLINYVLLGWLMGLSRIRATMVMQIGSNVLNMLLAILFALVLDAGVAGVAVATLVSTAAATLTGVFCLGRALPKLPARAAERLALLRSALDAGDMLRMARVNGHLLLRTACLLAQTNIFMATASTFGTVTLSANAILIQVMLIFSYLFEGIANASSVFAGRAIGRRSPELLRAIQSLTLRWTLLCAAVLAIFYATCHTGLLVLFTDLPAVLEAAAALSPWGIFFPLVAGPGLSVYGLFTGASITRPVFLSTLQALAVFLAVWAVAVPSFGNNGLWVAYLVFYLGRSVFLLPCQKQLVQAVQA